MLQLTRNVGQEIIIGDDIRIIVVKVQGCQATIAIDAPRNITVHRKEIYLRNQELKRRHGLLNADLK